MTTQTTESVEASTAVDSSTLVEAFQRTVAAAPDAPALRAHGETDVLTRRELADAVEEVAAGLVSLGLRRGETIGLITTNRPEFHIVDLAALHLGATPFSVYNTSSPEQISYLLDHAECRLIVCEPQFLERVRAADAPRLEHVVVIGGGDDKELTLDALRTRRPADFDFEATWRQALPDDVATLIYTSGTTGPPKGVELTHANLLCVLQTCNERFPFPSEGTCVSYLPTAHVADRIFSHYLFMVTGWTVTTVQQAPALFAAVGEVRPTWLLGVPRVWEKLRSALLARFAAMPEPQRSAVENGLDAALQKVRAEQSGDAVLAEVSEAVAAFDKAVLAPLRGQLGLDNVSLLMTGAAPIPTAVHEFFLALGLPLAEGYGMSETGALGMTNLPGEIRLGYVGKAMPGTEAKIAEDGELLLRGPHVMRGYRKDPVKTAEAVDADGWLHTGDIATCDDGWYKIVDRKKELIINAGGKNMSPANIESALKSASPLIGQAFCYGDGRPYNVALLVLDPDAAAAYAADHGLVNASIAEVAADPAVQDLVAAAVEAANGTLSRIEQIKHYELLTDEWLPDSDELTPTSKLKRRSINLKYAEAIAGLYETGARR
ncbi:AMP-dependent synthetase/ligase [Rhodococcus qingshengii]|uniref:AMP-dependent synthetase/ligase n=1 Tax=Rhodococcus qingshengii TaxID=334542 RepID=UPI0036DDE07C